MSPEPGLTTRVTLLARLRTTPAEDDWRQFVDRYGPAVYGWCRRCGGLQEADAADVTQQVLLQVYQQMTKPDPEKRFRYDPAKGRFRGWLHTVARNAWVGWREAQTRHAGSGDSGALARLHNVAAGDDLVARLDETFDRELLDIAVERARAEFEPRTFAAFDLTRLQGLTGAEAAERLGVSVDAVYQNAFRVTKRVREIIRELDPDAAPTGGNDRE